MIPVFDFETEKRFREVQYRQNDLLKQAALARKSDTTEYTVVGPLFVWLGERLVTWGCALQTHFDTCRQVQLQTR